MGSHPTPLTAGLRAARNGPESALRQRAPHRRYYTPGVRPPGLQSAKRPRSRYPPSGIATLPARLISKWALRVHRQNPPNSLYSDFRIWPLNPGSVPTIKARSRSALFTTCRLHVPPRDLMPLEREDPHPDRKCHHPRVGVGRVDPEMRRIAELIIKELLPAMGTLETVPWTPPQNRRSHRRRVARWC